MAACPYCLPGNARVDPTRRTRSGRRRRSAPPPAGTPPALPFAIHHHNLTQAGIHNIQNANLGGFSQQEQQLLAVLVRAHRRKFPVDDINALPVRWKKQATRLAILLRIAVTLNRGNGSFAGMALYGGNNQPRFVDMGDLDRDGDLDLAVSNSGSNEITILLSSCL